MSTRLEEIAPSEQIRRFRSAADAYEAKVRDRIGHAAWADTTAVIRRSHGGRLPNEQLVDALDGLDLTRAEWHLMEWALSMDLQDTLASIVTKARAQGPSEPSPQA